MRLLDGWPTTTTTKLWINDMNNSKRNSATKATKVKNSRGSQTKYAVKCKHSDLVRQLRQEIRDLKAEVREQTKWADEYFRTCENLNHQLNKFREKNQSLLRTMVVQTAAPRKP
jgi:uncharacterized coiled-coil DUF342 family protein